MKQNELCFPHLAGFPALYLKHVYVEYGYPVLFSCYSEEGGLFLVSCYRADGEKKEWVIAQTTAQSIIAMLEDKITIREPFDVVEQDKYLMSLDASGRFESQKVLLGEIPIEILPTVGCYMEAEQGEFDEEIEELQELCDYSETTWIERWDWIPKKSQFTVQTGISRWTEKLPMFPNDEHMCTSCGFIEQVIAI